MAMDGNTQIETAILELLKNYPDGLSNQDVIDKLNLSSSHEGGQKNYLTYRYTWEFDRNRISFER